MKAHEFEVGQAVIWHPAFQQKPIEGTIIERDGWVTHEPYYSVELEGGLGWYPLGESVLRARPDETPVLAPLVGLVGRKRVGKDTVAAELVEHYGFTRLGFADALKDLALDINPIVDWDYLFQRHVRLVGVVDSIGWEAAKNYPEVRRLLQRLGERARVRLGETVWIDRVLDKAFELRRQGVPVVISDVRYANEAELIKQAAGTTIKITRPGLEITDNHPSEAGPDLIETDLLITNDTTLAGLLYQAHGVAEELNITPTADLVSV